MRSSRRSTTARKRPAYKRGKSASHASHGSGFNAVRALRDLGKKRHTEVTRTLSEQTKNNADSFAEKFRKLKNMAKQHRKAARKDAHQYTWLRTQAQLTNEAAKIEGELKVLLGHCASSAQAISSSSRRSRAASRHDIDGSDDYDYAQAVPSFRNNIRISSCCFPRFIPKTDAECIDPRDEVDAIIEEMQHYRYDNRGPLSSHRRCLLVVQSSSSSVTSYHLKLASACREAHACVRRLVKKSTPTPAGRPRKVGGRGRAKAAQIGRRRRLESGSNSAGDLSKGGGKSNGASTVEELRMQAEARLFDAKTLLEDAGEQLKEEHAIITSELRYVTSHFVETGEREGKGGAKATAKALLSNLNFGSVLEAEKMKSQKASGEVARYHDLNDSSSSGTIPPQESHDGLLSFEQCLEGFVTAFKFSNLPDNDSSSSSNNNNSKTSGSSEGEGGTATPSKEAAASSTASLTTTNDGRIAEIRAIFRAKLDELDRNAAEALCRAHVDHHNSMLQINTTLDALQVNGKSIAVVERYSGRGNSNHSSRYGDEDENDAENEANAGNEPASPERPFSAREDRCSTCLTAQPWATKENIGCMGAWTNEDSKRLWLIHDTYVLKHGQNKAASNGSDLYRDRLRVEFPGRPYKELQLRIRVLIEKRLFRRKKNALLTQWERDKRAVLEEAASQTRVAAMAMEFEEELTAERDMEEVKRQEIKRIHSSNVEKFLIKKKIEDQQRAQQEAEAAAAQIRKEKQRQRELEANEERLREYYAEKTEMERKKQQELMEAAILEEKLRRKRAIVNKERVEYRMDLLEEKQHKQLEKKLEIEREEMEQQRRLDLLRQQVASQFEHVGIDKDRVIQNTKAYQHALDAKNFKPLFEVHGYNIDELMQDQRFKIATALQAAGLHKNSYAKQVILKAHTAVQSRPSMVSNFELKD
eukprot:jgi/Bigna1/88990/estExt_fgenesh1_pg.C_420005